MTIKTTFAVIALMLAPTFALADGCIHGRMQSASECAPGQVWDVPQQICVPVVSS